MSSEHTIRARRADTNLLAGDPKHQHRIARLRVEILTFRQKEKESLGVAWSYLTDLVSLGLDLAIAKPTLLQHFYLGLSQIST